MEGIGIKPNDISYSAGIAACFACERHVNAHQLLSAQDSNLIPTFASSPDGKYEWDLHGKTLPVSCMLLAESLIRLVLSENYKTAQWKEIVVVTGQGHGSGDIGPVLQQQVPQFLSDHNGPEISCQE